MTSNWQLGLLPERGYELQLVLLHASPNVLDRIEFGGSCRQPLENDVPIERFDVVGDDTT